jgi:hypothetical protein
MISYSEKIATELRSEGWTVDWNHTGDLWQVTAHSDDQQHFEIQDTDLAAAFVELEQMVRSAG